jgi:small subunit ribosomal protein S9
MAEKVSDKKVKSDDNQEKLLKKFQQGSAKVKYFSGTGRRKRAVAQVRIVPGKGEIVVNGKNIPDYFNDQYAEKFILYPLELTGQAKKFDISVLVAGGGKMAQREAVRLGIARALTKFDETLRTTLKKSDLLTRDPREKERKKYGLKRARKAPQWAKR